METFNLVVLCKKYTFDYTEAKEEYLEEKCTFRVYLLCSLAKLFKPYIRYFDNGSLVLF